MKNIYKFMAKVELVYQKQVLDKDSISKRSVARFSITFGFVVSAIFLYYFIHKYLV
ncbi:hypothetical protein [Campylobacter sp. RM9328]|uniref:hypothetical protein n=1 Tax=Campylobacter sp. RM9328 TaxID=1705720 RepID=UPI00147645D7|nr:hypothetical protein [Campylobacter sp. RM9328]